MSSNLESDEALYWSVIIQELGQVLVTICCREPAISLYEPNVMLQLNINQLLSLVSLTLGELPLVDEVDVVRVRAQLGRDDPVLGHGVVPGVGQRLRVPVAALPPPQPGEDVHQLLVRLPLDDGQLDVHADTSLPRGRLERKPPVLVTFTDGR